MKSKFLYLGIVFSIIIGFVCYYNIVTEKETETLIVQDENFMLGLVEAEDLEVAGIKLGASTFDLTWKYGDPDREEIIKYNKYGDIQGEKYLFYYPDFKLICYDDGEAGYRIVAASITGRNIKTTRGVSIGSSETEVFERYGEIEKNNNWITYTSASDISKEISFKIIKGEVAEIAIYYGNNPFDVE